MNFIRSRNLFLDRALPPRRILGSHQYLLATNEFQTGKFRTAATLAGELKKQQGSADTPPVDFLQPKGRKTIGRQRVRILQQKINGLDPDRPRKGQDCGPRPRLSLSARIAWLKNFA